MTGHYPGRVTRSVACTDAIAVGSGPWRTGSASRTTKSSLQDGCPYKDRLGPYETEAEAARALEKAAERTKAWDEDPAWNDDVEDKE